MIIDCTFECRSVLYNFWRAI